MATLNTLRTRGALILTIFIGVALLAFLLQDLTSASSVFQSGRNRVGSVNGKNIDYQEFAIASDNQEQVMQTVYGRSSLSAEETDRVRDMVWETYVRRYSLDPGYRRLGISVGEPEQVDMAQGEYTSPVLMSLFGSPQTGELDQTVLASFLSNVEQDPTGRLESAWRWIKDQMASERTSAKYMSLVKGGAFVNNLEVARALDIAGKTYNGRFAQVPFSTIADSLVTPSSNEARAYYNEHKNRFRQQASRDIEYVLYEVAPSETDYADAAAHIETVASEFAAAENPMQYASANSQERTDARYYSEAVLPLDIAAIAFGDRRGEMAGPTLNGNVYTMSRVVGERMMPDSVGARHILLPLTRAASADSLVAAIEGGASIFDLAPAYSIDQNVDLGVFPPEMMVEPFAEAVRSARAGDIFKVDTQFGTHVVQMTYRSPLVQKVQIATVTYNIEPSAATEQAAYNGARDFLTAAAGSKEKFDAAVTSTGASRRVASIRQGDRDVSGLTNSRELVRWSFNTKPGTVSPIFEIDDDYVIAVVGSAKEAGIADISDVLTSIVYTLRNEKKAAMITEQMAGLGIDQIAELKGATKDDVTGLKADAYYDTAIGSEPAVIGAFEGLSAGATSKPVQGMGGMYVVSVSSVDAATGEGAPTEASERVLLEATSEASLPQRVMQALTDQSDIKDNRSKFF